MIFFLAAKTQISALFNMGWYVLSGSKKGIAVAGGGLLDYIVDEKNEERVESHGQTQERIYFHVITNYYFIFVQLLSFIIFSILELM